MDYSSRELRGFAIILQGNQIELVDERSFHVKSQTNAGTHRVTVEANRKWTCDCPDFLKNRKDCKHIFAVKCLSRLPEVLRANASAFSSDYPSIPKKNYPKVQLAR